MTSVPDPAVAAHLAIARRQYVDTGAVEYVRDIVRDTWRINLSRWSPGRHFDDTNTLGYQTSRNVNNRIYRTIETSNVAPDVLAETESGVVILVLRGFRLRVVKAPIESGLTPDFENDFDWSTSAIRAAAARRNSNNYYPFAPDEWAFDFDGDPRPRHRRQVDQCRELILVWAAALNSDETAGWLGLPRLGDSPWMGVVELWADERPSRTALEHDDEPDRDEDEDPDDEDRDDEDPRDADPRDEDPG